MRAWSDGLELVTGGAPGSGPQQGPSDVAFAHIVGQSRALRGAVEYARHLAGNGSGLLLLVGESGTGKGVFARAIHYARPGHGPFLSVSCKTAAPALLETELFGHEAGVFEGALEPEAGILELAGTGTVLLEHVDRLPQRLQPKLFKALSERLVRRRGGLDEVAVRCTVVATASRPLEQMLADGTFRQDLFLLLNDARIALPALRERSDDVVVLARHFLAETLQEQGLAPMRLSDDAQRALQAYAWPGNVRELQATVRHAAESCTGGLIQARHLDIRTRTQGPLLDAMPPATQIPIPAEGRSFHDIEAQVVRHALLRARGEPAEAARLLDLAPAELMRKILAHGLDGLLARSDSA